jgi:hypothetical protein
MREQHAPEVRIKATRREQVPLYLLPAHLFPGVASHVDQHRHVGSTQTDPVDRACQSSKTHDQDMSMSGDGSQVKDVPLPADDMDVIDFVIHDWEARISPMVKSDFLLWPEGVPAMLRHQKERGNT